MDYTNMNNLPALRVDKKSISLSAINIYSQMSEGDISPLDLAERVKALEELLKELKGLMKDSVIDEIQKYGKSKSGPGGSNISVKESGVEWDFTVCQDSEYNTLSDSLEKSKAELKQREEFLKTVTKKMTIVDEDSGDITTLYPPIKKSSTTFSVTLPK